MEVKTLGELCNIVSGGTPSRSKVEFWKEGTIPWIKIGNIKEKYVNEADEYITQAGLDGSSAKMFAKGTVLYTIFATLGEVGILGIDACTNQAIAGLTIKDTNQLNTDYLYYYLKSKKNYVNKISRGVAQNNINMSMLRSFELPLPEISKQEEIVAILDKVFAIINDRQHELQKLDELIKSRFVEMFGDPEKNTNSFPVEKLGNLCNVRSSKRIYQSEQCSKGVPFLRISDLSALIDKASDTSNLYISDEKYTELFEQGLVPSVGDVLITSRGTLGKCYIIKENDRFYFQDGMISWLSNISDKITSLYLSYLFSMTGIQKQIINLQAGSTVAYLSISMLKKLDIMIPPKKMQERFAAFVAQIDKSKLTIQKSLEELETLNKALMQKYFGGNGV